ncbi:CS1 type fimbrial major subunit [Pseudomonas sp. R37(2017)]|uniref:CS1 type fimbrial major subunit n=1 Tax=Pseudomonas sp. R37(2017) TaxID=1981685 RepID=UPI000A1E8004|nr:CS1 type fimbrial major subunit [Pseudomonas sp. R37(2017)]
MFRKLLAKTLLVFLVLNGKYAFAVVERETFEVSVTIPSADFYVLPVDPEWLGREQKLDWIQSSEDLSRLRKSFDVKNTNGSILARLSTEPYLSNGRENDNIALDVSFNRKKLTVDNAEVVSEVDGKAGRRVWLDIAAVKPQDGFKPGEYYGSVHMIFEAIAP